ncbi:MAG: ABC transporter substrate-binding protein [Clostridia bacterium]|nr:ABC transporter substrate-binding protein [Clostridia bacterium]
MSKFSKVLCLTLALAMVCVCFAGCGGAKAGNYTAKNTEFVIGMSGPLTGPAAIYGIGVKNGAQLAVDEINEQGGLNGIKFKLEATDDMHDTKKVSTNYSSLLEKGMQVSLGCVTSAPCAEWTDLSHEDNVFFLTPSASNDDIPKYENGYQMCFADGNQGIVAAEYVNDNFKGQTIGIFYKSDDNYSAGIYNKFKDSLSKDVKTIDTVFTAANETSFDEQINKLKDCKFIFMPIYYTPASIFMTQAKGIIADDAVYYGCDGFDGIDKAEGFDITSIPQEVSMLSHFDSNATEGVAADFIKKYTDAFGTETLNQFAASAYDCVYALYGAMKKADVKDVTISASDLSDILQKEFTGGYAFENGVTGGGEPITWESTGYVNKKAIKFIIKEMDK